jgi:hypothetical protein
LRVYIGPAIGRRVFPKKEDIMKCLALLLLVLVFVCAVEAREVGTPMWGIKGGISGANMYGDDTGIFKTRYGGLFGGSVEYPFTEMISFQGEVLYAMKGWKNDKYCGGSCEISHSITQIEIPLLLRLNSTATGPGPYLIMGPALYIGISDDFEVKANGITVPIDDEDFTVRSTEFGVVMGGGMEFPGEKYTISVEARGSVGGTPAYEDIEMGALTREIDAQNMTASLAVGVGF